MQAGTIEAMKPETASKDKQGRNYELDFFRVVFALLVFLYHTAPFISESTGFELPPQLGAGSVHFFFILSGMLMANSIVKHGSADSCGRSAIGFVLGKFRSFAPQYLAAVALAFVTRAITTGDVARRAARLFPEVSCLYASGVWVNNNAATWYLSAMLICMLPLAYLLYAKRDLTLYVLAPLISVLTFGYMCKSNDFQFLAHTDLYGIAMGGLVRGMCGLCAGICAYTMYVRIRNASLNRRARVLLTIAEIMLYALFFTTWFLFNNDKVLMSVMLMLPVPVAITFSGQSYLGCLFRFRWMRYFAPLSLSIYLNQLVARDIVDEILPGGSYGACVGCMIAFTAVLCVVNMLIVKGCRALWSKKLKPYLTRPDSE